MNIIVYEARSATEDESIPSAKAERHFSLAEIQSAEGLLIERGGFGRETDAVKRLKSNSRQGRET